MKVLSKICIVAVLLSSFLLNEQIASAQNFNTLTLSNSYTGLFAFNNSYYENSFKDVNDSKNNNSNVNKYDVVCSSLTSGGVIASNQQNCGSFTAAAFTSNSAASGGSGGTIKYQWQKLENCGSWTDISGATSTTYSAGTVTKSTIYRRKAWRDCDNVAVYSNQISILVVYAGTITGDETKNCNYTPTTITGTDESTKNNYCIDANPQNQSIQWQQSINNGVTWTDISGANSLNYSPGQISTTTLYRRATTVSGYTCYSNTVTKTVNNTPVVLYTEPFPNCFNTGFSAPINSTFTGSTGTWSAYSTTSRSTIVVHDAYYQSSPWALKIVNYSTYGYAASTARATSPKLNLSGGSNVELSFRLYTYSISTSNTCHTFNVEFSSDNGSTWSSAYTQTAKQIATAYGQGTWNTITIQVPVQYYNSNFRYRIAGVQQANCNFNTYLYVDDITIKSIPTCVTCPTQGDVNAGVDKTNCNNSSFTMSASTVPNGSIGTWSVVAGAATFDDINSPTATATVTTSPATLRWTISTPSCTNVYDDVILTNNTNIVTISNEQFPNSFNTGFTAPINTTFTGTIGTWGASSNNGFSTIVVHSSYYQSSPYALKIVNYNNSGNVASTAKATSPLVNLTGGNNVNLSFRLYTYSVSSSNNSYTFNVELSSDNGGTWSNVYSQTSKQLATAYGQGTWNTITIPVPAQYYNANFKYRISGVQPASCGYDTYLYVDDITIKSYPSCLPCPTQNDVNAGIDQTNCNNGSFTMSASTVPTGSTGTWSVVSGSATIANVNSPTTTVTVTNSPVTLRWTISTPSCTNVYDDVVLTNTNSVVILSNEAFPNSFNTGFSAPINSTFAGSIGTWSAYSSNGGSTIVVNNANIQSPPYAIKLYNPNTNGGAATTNRATSPTVNLTSGNNVEMTFRLYTYSVSTSNTCFTFNVEFSKDNGSTWSNVLAKTSKQLYDTYGQGTWNTVTISVPALYYNANFKYRLSGVQNANCNFDTYLYIDDILFKSYTPCLPCPTSNDVDAGSDQSNCNNATFTMSGSAVPQGSTGTWSVVSGSATIANVNSPTTTVTVSGSPATLRWTITTPGCSSPVSDDVVLTNNITLVTLSNESFPNGFNTGFSAPINSTFTGSTGTWNAYSSTSRSTIVVYNAVYQTSPWALKIVNYNTNGYAASTASATSPKLNLTSGNNVEMTFRLYTYSVSYNNTCYTLKLEFSKDNGSTWDLIQSGTAQDIANNFGQSTWNTVTYSVPASYYNSNFKYRFTSVQNANCNYDTYIYIDDIKFNSYPPCVPCPTQDDVDAGIDQNNCGNNTFTLNASAVPQGSTGTWTVVNGAATITDINSPTSTVTITSSPTKLRWTLTTPSCGTTFYDEVELSNTNNYSILFNESFPNTFNTSFSAPISSTFTGSIGTWSATSTNSFTTVVVNNAYYQSSPNALRLQHNNNSGSNQATNTLVTSPKLNLTGGNNVELTFKLYTYTVHSANTCFTFNVEISKDNGSTWSNVLAQTSKQLFDTYGQGTWNTITISIPATYYNANFKYRLGGVQQANCNYNAYLYIDDIILRSVTPCQICPTNNDVAAGADQAQCNNNTFTMQASAAPQGSTGTWSVISGAATIANLNSPTTTVTLTGSPATLKWTITTPGCLTPAYDTVTITNTTTTVADAGPNQSKFNNYTFTMAANTPANGETGIWSIISGSATISNINSPTTNVTITATPTVLRWTISKGECASTSDVQLMVILDNCGNAKFNPLTVAFGYDIFAQQGVTFKGGNTNGAVALGGNLTLDGTSIIAMNHSGYYPSGYNLNNNYSLVIGGSVNYTSGNITYVNSNGKIKLGNATGTTLWDKDPNNANVNLKLTSNALSGWSGYNSNPAIQLNSMQSTSSALTSSGLDFSASFASLVANAQTMSNYTASSSCSNNLNIINLSGTTPTITLVSNKINVVNITGANFAAITNITFSGTFSSTTPLIFNINQTGNITFNAFNATGIQNTDGQYIIYNFYNNTGTVTVNASNAVRGTIFAPTATVVWNGSNNLEGQIVAKNASLVSGEIHTQIFAACLPICYPLISISGNVYDAIVSCTPTVVGGVATNINNTLYANLVGTDNKVVSSVAVAANGTFSYSNINGNTTYNIILTAGSRAIGSILTSAALPSNYKSVMEYLGTGAGNDGTPNSILNVVTSNTNVTNANFEIGKDTDRDGIPDYIDIDDDNDGITDVNENGGIDPLGDCDCDGIPNYLDTNNSGCNFSFTDCNGDGINDLFDWDRDGVMNQVDLDSDNDGILDVIEARPNGVAFLNHNNGMITGNDPDGNGLLSSADNGSGFNNKNLNGLIPNDLDRDGTPNFLDLDSDGDGITDLTEAFGVYSATGVVTGTDTDGDGVRGENFGNNNYDVADNINGFGAKGIDLDDRDEDGKPNVYDIDSDNDGITDNAEAQATCAYKLPSGNDCDGDGVDDAYDLGGCNSCTRTSGGLTPFDKDGDSYPDYIDLDTDNDGALDIYEGHTVPGPGGHTTPPPNYWIGAAGDADGDGLMDYFDGFNIKTETGNFWRNVINNNMGNNGSWDTGVGPTGSISQLPKSRPGGCGVGDRDWRDYYILPVTLLDFKGNVNNEGIAKLNWSVTSEINMNYYDIERSTNGTEFTKVASVNANNPSSTATVSNYNVNDNVSALTGMVYYRLKLVDKDGSFKYSQIINFKLVHNTKSSVAIHPNPATTNFNIKLTTEKDETVIIRVIDMFGKVLINKQASVFKGINTININEISKFSSGTYSVQIMMNNQMFTEKLIITK